MKFGIHNPSWVFASDPAGIFDSVKAKAQWAEDHGFTWFSVMDHVIQIGNVGAPDEPFMEGWTVLSALAAVTRRIRLATLVSSVHYRNPALLAKIAAGVDQISRGRLTFGIGAGWFETEYIYRILMCGVNRLQLRSGGPFRRRQDVEQCPGSGGSDRFILVMKGGFQIGNKVSVADVAERTERNGFGAGKRILDQRRQQADRAQTIGAAGLAHGKRSRRSRGRVVMLRQRQ